jgi:hypothetical protein
VSYRDELQAAQARIESLERELATTRDELSGSRALVRLEPQEIARRERRQRRARRWLGGPTSLEIERIVEVATPESSYSQIVDYLSRKLEISGQISVLPGRFEWTSTVAQGSLGPAVAVTVTTADGRTSVRARERLANTIGAIYGGVGGGLGGGAIIAPIGLFALSPILGIIGLPLWVGGTYALCRRLFRRSVQKREARLEEAIEGVADIVRAAAEREQAG